MKIAILLNFLFVFSQAIEIPTSVLLGIRTGTFKLSLSTSSSTTSQVFFSTSLGFNNIQLAIGLSLLQDSTSNGVYGYTYQVSQLTSSEFTFKLTSFQNKTPSISFLLIRSVYYSFTYIASDDSMSSSILLDNNILLLSQEGTSLNYSGSSPLQFVYNLPREADIGFQCIVWCSSFQKNGFFLNLLSPSNFQLYGKFIDSTKLNISSDIALKYMKYLTASIIIIDPVLLYTGGTYQMVLGSNGATPFSNIPITGIKNQQSRLMSIVGFYGMNANSLRFNCQNVFDYCGSNDIQTYISTIFIVACPKGCAIGQQVNLCQCAKCSDGTYFINNSCENCSLQCLTCSGTSINCTSCSSDQPLVNSICICKIGAYNNSGSCTACLSSCLSCIDSNSCTDCPVNSNRNISANCNCLVGYYDGGNSQCQTCLSNCRTCSGANSCSSCPQGSNRNVSANCTCSKGSFENDSSQCQSCLPKCQTCSNAYSCSSCPGGSNRDANTNCQCLTGFYDSGLAQCQACMPNCNTCSNSNSCQSCPEGSNRNVSNNCSCSDGSFNNGSGNCQTCLTNCLTCSNATSCSSCAEGSNRNIYSNCSCNKGFYQNYNKCNSCSHNCVSCRSQNCSECQIGTEKHNVDFNGLIMLICVPPIDGQLTLNKQYLNKKVCILKLHVKLNFTFKIMNQKDSFWLYIDDEIIPEYQVTERNSQFQISFISQKEFRQIKIVTKPRALKLNDNFIALDSYTFSTKVKVEFYQESEVAIANTLSQLKMSLSGLSNNGQAGFILVGLGLYFVEMINFLNIVTLYAFIDMQRPGNLQSVIRDWIKSLQTTVLPRSNQFTPLNEYDYLFIRPHLFQIYDFSFNIVSISIVFAAQLCGIMLLYEIISWLSKKLGQGRIATALRNRFGPAAYSNGMECYLSSAINFGFCAAAVLLDRQIFCLYKSINYACGIVVVFLTGIIAFAHPVFLRSIKKVKYVDTEDCYLSADRLSHSSEVYVQSKVLLDSVIAISIPLTPPLVCLLLIMVVTSFKLVCAIKAIFSSRWIKIAKCLSIGFHCLLNLTYFAIYVANFNRSVITPKAYSKIGWVALGFIFICILIDIFIVFASLISELYQSIKNWRNTEEDAPRKRKKIIHTKIKVPDPSGLNNNQIIIKTARSVKFRLDNKVQPQFGNQILENSSSYLKKKPQHHTHIPLQSLDTQILQNLKTKQSTSSIEVFRASRKNGTRIKIKQTFKQSKNEVKLN